MERGWIGGEWGGLVVSWRVGLGDGLVVSGVRGWRRVTGGGLGDELAVRQ